MINMLAQLVALLYMVVALLSTHALPVSNQSFDLTGQDFTSVCGQSGTFTSGAVHLVTNSDCKTIQDISKCSLVSHLNMQGAKVKLYDGSEMVVTDTINTQSFNIFDSSTLSSSSYRHVVLNARTLQAGKGKTTTFSTNLNCETVNGVPFCKVDKVIEEC